MHFLPLKSSGGFSNDNQHHQQLYQFYPRYHHKSLMQMRYNATRKVERQENAVMSSKVTKEK